MYQGHCIGNHIIQSALMKFHIFSNLFVFQHLGKTSIKE